jgi:hypothetical protein
VLLENSLKTLKSFPLQFLHIVNLISTTLEQGMQITWVQYTQYRLNAWARWVVARWPHSNLRMLCMAYLLMFKYWICWKYQYNIRYKKCMFNLQFYSQLEQNNKPRFTCNIRQIIRLWDKLRNKSLVRCF